MVAPTTPSAGNENQCQPIKIEMCKGLPYNHTILPNLMGHQDQTEAMAKIKPYIPLVKVNCSEDLRLFLCSMFAPPCITRCIIKIYLDALPYPLQCNPGVLFFKIDFWVRFYSNLTKMGLYLSCGSIN